MSQSRKNRRRQSVTEKIMNAMNIKYPYNPYISEETGQIEEPGGAEAELSGSHITIFCNDDEAAETRSNPELKLHVKKKKVQWRKYSFPNTTSVI